MLQGLCARRALRAWSGLPLVEKAETPLPAPSVSIVVPARNEAATLPRLLPSLLAQNYPNVDVLVVDDGSNDATGEIARSFGVAVLPAPPLPSGWTGKPHACAAGAAHTAGAWLLFTDADTEHAPDAVTAMMAYARTSNLDAVSAFPEQICRSFWERLLVPYAFRHYFSGVSLRAIHDSSRPDALANGQYLLINRQSYERVGGHAAVRDSLIEDVALARLLKRHGMRARPVRAGHLVRVRMYDSLTAIRLGFAKNSSRFLLAHPRGGAWTLLSTVLDGVALPLLAAALLRRKPALIATGGASWFVAAAGLAPWLRQARVTPAYAALQPLAAAVFQWVALDGLRALRPGGTVWKGRHY